ncbi:unnamed protein product [Thelazia callipaeda]|uniref:GRIP domain-containing protein n=1 Tax=Thelazia callipaeda TaxID=103827 RepID=A0A158RD27_THECL|nr:unnamed protein product [Thelazia callipaeda]
MYNGGKKNDKKDNGEWLLLSKSCTKSIPGEKVTNISHGNSEDFPDSVKKIWNDSDKYFSSTTSVPQTNYSQPSERLSTDDSDLVDDSTSVAQLSTCSAISVTSASTSSFYPTVNITNRTEISSEHPVDKRLQETQDNEAHNRYDKYKKYTTTQNRLNELHKIIEEKEKQVRILRNGLSDKDLEIGKLCNKIRALEYNCERLQSVVESIGDEAEQNEVKVKELFIERDGLLVRNASLSRQMEFEKREWSIERERLSMELDDVTRELELQKMILNGESISEIVQRWQTKVFELEGMITDRDRAIRAQRLRISKLKQSIAETDRISHSNSLESQTKLDSFSLTYIKHLLLQYLTSSDEERIPLLRDVSSALHLSNEEERQVRTSLKNKIHIS